MQKPKRIKRGQFVTLPGRAGAIKIERSGAVVYKAPPAPKKPAAKKKAAKKPAAKKNPKKCGNPRRPGKSPARAWLKPRKKR